MRIFFLGLMFWTSLLWSQTNYMEQLVQASSLASSGDYTQAFSIFQKVLQQSPPQWVQNCAYSEMSIAYIRQNKVNDCLNALENAVANGFNNFILIHEVPEFRPLFTNPRFQEIYGKMRISEADMKEFYWIYSEIQSVNHETTMLITENMGRPDDQYTAIYPSQIPNRIPQSSTVLALRELLQVVQNNQKANVLQSDMSRISHNMNMNIINNMGGSEDANTRYWKEQEKQNKILNSIQQANQRAQQRQNAVQQRRFVLPANTSTVLQPCPKLGSISSTSPNNTTSNTNTNTNQNTSSQKETMNTFQEAVQPLGRLCGTWEGTGKDGESTFSCAFQGQPAIDNSFLQLNFTLKRESGPNAGQIEHSMAMITYEPNSRRYIWYHFHAPGSVIQLVGSIAADQKSFQFEFADGSPIYCNWKITDNQFEVEVQTLQNGEVKWFSSEKYFRKK